MTQQGVCQTLKTLKTLNSDKRTLPHPLGAIGFKL